MFSSIFEYNFSLGQCGGHQQRRPAEAQGAAGGGEAGGGQRAGSLCKIHLQECRERICQMGKSVLRRPTRKVENPSRVVGNVFDEIAVTGLVSLLHFVSFVFVLYCLLRLQAGRPPSAPRPRKPKRRPPPKQQRPPCPARRQSLRRLRARTHPARRPRLMARTRRERRRHQQVRENSVTHHASVPCRRVRGAWSPTVRERAPCGEVSSAWMTRPISCPDVRGPKLESLLFDLLQRCQDIANILPPPDDGDEHHCSPVVAGCAAGLTVAVAGPKETRQDNWFSAVYKSAHSAQTAQQCSLCCSIRRSGGRREGRAPRHDGGQPSEAPQRRRAAAVAGCVGERTTTAAAAACDTEDDHGDARRHEEPAQGLAGRRNRRYASTFHAAKSFLFAVCC